MTTLDMPDLSDVREARERIAPLVRRTPVVVADGLAFKLEFFQHTGSFKPRGAFNAALQLPRPQTHRIIAVSGGNHGLAVAYVGRSLGIPVWLAMPKTTPAYVVDRAFDYGAEVYLADTIAAAFDACAEKAAEGGAFLHPFDDVNVIAGQATIGLEILEEYPQVSQLLISIGGGGLLAGIASVIKELRPDVRIVGVETIGADAMRQALDVDAVVALPGITSIARTLGAPAVCERTLRATQRYVDDVVVVDDAAAVAAIRELQERLGITVEPAAACTLAALRTGAVREQPNTLLVMCGRNVRLDEIETWTKRFLV